MTSVKSLDPDETPGLIWI